MISRKWSPCSFGDLTCNHVLTWGKSISRLAITSCVPHWSSHTNEHLQQETAGFALADLSCFSASSVDLNDRLALLRVAFFIHSLKHHCTQVDATLCRTKARKSLSACGRSRCGCILKDRPRHSRGHLPWHAHGRQSSPIGLLLNNYEAALIPDRNEATGVHHRSSHDVNGGDNRLICRKINKYSWKLRLSAYKEGNTLPCKAFKWKIITLLKESVCVAYLLFRQHFS